ncbi:uncharacterized protein EDB91DRAFT_1267913 [Suillus paluster]|uniref:uncharacterized protein n=1 Tax=Suillus paluster TaxID=48578 RepID=UPI001B878A9D|nr:uncharacterized protein EDB91DRAFT_1257598 [Suillus paluster]XP_041170650.1 uncharacterized protein EDB91DRAFT_1267913 [Suillus paluster]KAG1719499.1 hypothetical protein EDB91DRAFT_1257598 [Suillus paluster]KAG1724822.1 hypothetical protein EDB91DRAFT_1267913 [Suillus paluster]
MDPKGNNLNQELFCRGLKSDSQMCDCEEFFPRTQDEGHCAECGHGRSKHPRKASTSREPVLEVQEDADEKPHPSSAVAIKDIFTRITGGKTVNDNLKLATTGKQGSLVPLTSAREEALSTLTSTRLAGYHKLAKGPVPSAGSRKDRKEITSSQMVGSQARRNTSSSVSMSGNTFRVASVAMLTCGVDRNGLIRVSKVPSKNGQNEIQAMKNRGCYLEQQFVIEGGWTYRKVTSQLRSWFPKVFDYLDGQVEKRQSATLREEKPIWRLLNKCGQTLTVVDIGFPAGSDLAKHKGRDKASVSDCHLWFVTRNRIPDSVYESWNTQPVIAGSDSERDDCNDILLSDTDDSVSIKSDNDLASSLMELDMSSDLDVKDPKGKGKAKAAPTRSPMRSRNAKRSHTLLSPSPSEATRKAVQKKLKKEPASDTAVPLFSMNSESASPELKLHPSTQPSAQSNSYKTVSFRTMTSRVPATLKVENKISAPPDFVSVSEADVLWRDKIQDDDPFAEYINPWDSHYSMLNLANLRVI